MAETRYMEKPWLKSYEKGVPEFIKYEEICMPDILDRTAKQFPDKPALIFQGTTVTFGELKEMVDRFAACLADFGIKKGDAVAILLPNIIPCVVGLLRDPEDRGDHRDEQPPLFGSGTGTPVQRFRRQGPDHAGSSSETG